MDLSTRDFLSAAGMLGDGCIKVALYFLSSIAKFNYKSVRIVGKNIRKLVKDRLIMRKVVATHSRSRVKKWAEAKRKGK